MAYYAVNNRLSTIANAWRNDMYIADQVMPVVQVPAANFERREFTRDWRIPNTEIGNTGIPHRVGQNSTLVQEALNNHALGWEVSLTDLEDQRNQDMANSVDIIGHEVEATVDLMALAREQRVAKQVAASANYTTDNLTTLSGTSKWSAKESKPIKALIDALRSMPVRANCMVIGHNAWDALSTHPQVAKLVNRSDGDVAIASPMQLAAYLRLDRILIGMSWSDKSKQGQSEDLEKLWGNNCALLRLDAMPGTPRNPKPVWGLTAQLGGRRVYQWRDLEPGVDGVVKGKVADRCKELVIFKEAGYLFKTVA